MKAETVPNEEAVGRCSWCGEKIGDNTPVHAFGGKKRPGVDLTEYEGSAIRMFLATQKKEVVCIVPAEDSPARADGYDFMFMVCSEKCGREMKSVMEQEASLGDALFNRLDEMGNLSSQGDR